MPARGAVFERRVREALGRLHDLPYLQTHPLAARAGGGKALQRDLAETLDALGSGPRDGRAHRLLVMTYAEALPAREVWRRLGLSKSAYYREHGRAVGAVASLLQERWALGGRPAVGASPVRPAGLPVPPTTLVGREAELAEVARLLGEARLVTLTGPPGVGKTRLALEVAARRRSAYGGGAHVVPLAAVREAGGVLPTIAAVVDGPGSNGRSAAGGPATVDRLATVLGTREVLLVLDNLEQVAGAGTAIAALLAACPGVVALATSRSRVRVRGERVVSVAPLPLPPRGRSVAHASLARSPAVALFAERARAVAPRFALSAENAPAVAEVCRRLDGLPLAIELAAAWTGVLPPAALLARLGARLDLLTGGPEDLPPRQRTLRTALDWSHDLLAPAERVLFRRLAVFAGGWDLPSAEAVCGEPGGSGTEVLAGLRALVERSLVLQQPQADGEPWFWMLETAREYASERLVAAGEAEAVGRRYVDYVQSVADRVGWEALRRPAWFGQPTHIVRVRTPGPRTADWRHTVADILTAF